MSWILGAVAEETSPVCKTLSLIHPAPLFSIRKECLYIAAGGLPQTCLSGKLPTTEKGAAGWIVLGLGIEKRDSTRRFLSTLDWNSILQHPEPDLSALDGHFVILKWSSETPQTIHCYTDQLGLRHLYLSRVKGGIVFSTRLDWTCRATKQNEINLDALSSHWLTFNQLTPESLVQGVQKLGAGGLAVLTTHSLSIRHDVWELPAIDSTRESRFESALNLFAPIEGDEYSPITLGLSGGLDSRTLLSLLASKLRASCHLHTFGSSEDPDVRIARQLASCTGLPILHLDDSIPSAETCIPLVSDYAAQTCVIEPASTALRLRYFERLQQVGLVLIDGGFSEITRRQYFNRLPRFGRRAITDRDPHKILPFIRHYRASIFSEEVMETMRRMLIDRLDEVLNTLPDPRSIGVENFVDLLAIRTRIPNWGAYEQSRMDGQIVNYMPFAQPSLLRTVFRIPPAQRTNGKLFKRIIGANMPPLTAFPLVKGGTTHPFNLPTLHAALWVRGKRMLRRSFPDSTPETLLDRLSEYIQDTINSVSPWTCSLYDIPRIRALAERYYSGDKRFARELDWWIAFELWRRSLERN